MLRGRLKIIVKQVPCPLCTVINRRSINLLILKQESVDFILLMVP